MRCTLIGCDYHYILPDYAEDDLQDGRLSLESSKSTVKAVRPHLLTYINSIHEDHKRELDEMEWARYHFCCAAYRASLSDNMQIPESAISFASTINKYMTILRHVLDNPRSISSIQHFYHDVPLSVREAYPGRFECYVCDIMQYLQVMRLLADCEDFHDVVNVDF